MMIQKCISLKKFKKLETPFKNIQLNGVVNFKQLVVLKKK